MHLVSMAREAFVGRAIQAIGHDMRSHLTPEEKPAGIALRAASIVFQDGAVDSAKIAEALGYCVAAEMISGQDDMFQSVAVLTDWLEFEILEVAADGEKPRGLPN